MQVSAPGILDAKEDDEFIMEMIADIVDAVEKQKPRASEADIKEAARLAVRRMIKRDLDKKPVIEVLLTRV